MRKKSFITETRGIAAIEFAIAAPFLVLMVVGFVELDRYAWATRQLEVTASSIAQMLSQSQRVQPADMKYAQDSVMVLFPRVLQDSARTGQRWDKLVKVGMSVVRFTPSIPDCVADCVYQAQIAWSGGSDRRPCGAPLSAVANETPPNSVSLPRDVFGASNLIVVDLTYAYRPVFAEKIFGEVTIKRSSYLQPRYVNTLPYAVAGGDSFVTTCA